MIKGNIRRNDKRELPRNPSKCHGVTEHFSLGYRAYYHDTIGPSAEALDELSSGRCTRRTTSRGTEAEMPAQAPVRRVCGP